MNKYAIVYFDDNNKTIRILFKYDSLKRNEPCYKVLKNAVPIINIETETLIFEDGKFMDTRLSRFGFQDIDIYMKMMEIVFSKLKMMMPQN